MAKGPSDFRIKDNKPNPPQKWTTYNGIGGEPQKVPGGTGPGNPTPGRPGAKKERAGFCYKEGKAK
jgi:hypothetical protein